MRESYQETLETIERDALGGIDLVVDALDDAMQATLTRDLTVAASVVAGDDPLDDRCRDSNVAILSLLALQTPVASDLRAVVALIDVVGRIERMGDQCVSIAKLVMLDERGTPTDVLVLDAIASMGGLVREQLLMARDAFGARDVALAEQLEVHDRRVNALNREVFRRGVEIGTDPDLRRWAMHMTLVARCLERIGDNAVDVGGRAAFIKSGQLREFNDASRVRER